MLQGLTLADGCSGALMRKQAATTRCIEGSQRGQAWGETPWLLESLMKVVHLGSSGARIAGASRAPVARKRPTLGLATRKAKYKPARIHCIRCFSLLLLGACCLCLLRWCQVLAKLFLQFRGCCKMRPLRTASLLVASACVLCVQSLNVEPIIAILGSNAQVSCDTMQLGFSSASGSCFANVYELWLRQV